MTGIASNLCLVSWCALAFAQSSDTFKVWLPIDPIPHIEVIDRRHAGELERAKPLEEGVSLPAGQLEEIRVAMFWDPATEKPVRQLGARIVASDAELQTLIKKANEDSLAEKKPRPLILDADSRLPWRDAIKVVELAKRSGIENVEFAMGPKRPLDAVGPGKDSGPQSAPASRKSGASATEGPASRGSRANDRADDPHSTTVWLLHREDGGSFSCDAFRNQLRCVEDHWFVQVGSREYTMWAALKDGLQREAMLEPQPVKPDQKARLSDRRVTIRADPLARYGDVQSIIEICGSVGLYKLEVGLVKPSVPK